MTKETVTLRDVYDAVNRLEDKFSKRLDDVEDDVENLKSFQNKSLGILSILSLFVGSISSYIWSKLTN